MLSMLLLLLLDVNYIKQYFSPVDASCKSLISPTKIVDLHSLPALILHLTHGPGGPGIGDAVRQGEQDLGHHHISEIAHLP